MSKRRPIIIEAPTPKPPPPPPPPAPDLLTRVMQWAAVFVFVVGFVTLLAPWVREMLPAERLLERPAPALVCRDAVWRGWDGIHRDMRCSPIGAVPVRWLEVDR